MTRAVLGFQQCFIQNELMFKSIFHKLEVQLYMISLGEEKKGEGEQI